MTYLVGIPVTTVSMYEPFCEKVRSLIPESVMEDWLLIEHHHWFFSSLFSGSKQCSGLRCRRSTWSTACYPSTSKVGALCCLASSNAVGCGAGGRAESGSRCAIGGCRNHTLQRQAPAWTLPAPQQATGCFRSPTTDLNQE